ncbi:hypothetical protein WJX84_002314 [Apatococcus fuscideae]|uniref:Chromosome transmission fidelity protein 8 n=1 Tax=Apatococcus fuscideae TaxID=2026836 RepID=A0AAW1TH39_9CHLO
MLEIIRLNPASSCTDYVMVELQGEVDCHSDKTTTARTIGTMCQAHQTADTLQLTIGHHQLTGKLVDLKKPLVVLQKVSDPHINYQAVGIIRRKYHFKTRPRAMISKPHS